MDGSWGEAMPKLTSYFLGIICQCPSCSCFSIFASSVSIKVIHKGLLFHQYRTTTRRPPSQVAVLVGQVSTPITIHPQCHSAVSLNLVQRHRVVRDRIDKRPKPAIVAITIRATRAGQHPPPRRPIQTRPTKCTSPPRAILVVAKTLSSPCVASLALDSNVGLARRLAPIARQKGPRRSPRRA